MMKTCHALAITLFLLTAGGGAAQELSQGHIAEARVLGLDAHLFTRSELAQITAEPTLRDRRDRLRFILQMKERRGELPKGFTRSEGDRMARRLGWW